MNIKRFALSALLALAAAMALAADPVLAPNAPKDKPTPIPSPERFERAIAPYVAHARATYPQAKKRFLAGLPVGQSFFLTARLSDRKGNVEQVFVAVKTIRDGVATGRRWNDVMHVEGFRRGDTFTFHEHEMIDWLITKPDGSEEGNAVGKFLDTYDGRQSRSLRRSLRVSECLWGRVSHCCVPGPFRHFRYDIYLIA